MAVIFNEARQRVVSPAELGLSAVTLAAERTSNPISLQGIRAMSVWINLTRGGSLTRFDLAADFTPEGLINGQAPTNYYKQQSVSIAAGAGTLSEYVAQKTTSVSALWEVRYTDLNASYCQLRVSAGAGGASASDVVSVTVILQS